MDNRNPNQEKYWEAQKRAWFMAAGNRFPMERKVCATCVFWEGYREINPDGKSVQSDYVKCAYCQKQFSSHKSAGDTCIYWTSFK